MKGLNISLDEETKILKFENNTILIDDELFDDFSMVSESEYASGVCCENMQHKYIPLYN